MEQNKEKLKDEFHAFSVHMAKDIEERMSGYEDVEDKIIGWWIDKLLARDNEIKEMVKNLERDKHCFSFDCLRCTSDDEYNAALRDIINKIENK